jgi:nucleotide-binding universal stress UspA family protein
MTIKRILVPTDFSTHADAALRYAIALATPLGATVGLLHVIEDPLAAGMWASELYSAEIAGLQINLAKDAEERLSRTVAEIASSVVTDREVRTGRAAATITEAAAESKADLIVMGTAGRTGLAHVLMGSVAERVVRTAPCPVLTVRAATEAAAAPHEASTVVVV